MRGHICHESRKHIPRDMLIAALFWRPLLMMSFTAQLKPSMMMEVAELLPAKTLTATMLADLATP